MPPRVAVLPPEVAARIAAGEVIERPASVVKELVENALDAGARTVEVELEDAGRTLIRVRDDGCGMSPEDACLAIQRHATSKIRSLEDLRRLRSLGFRGEALPSIAAVSRLEIVTREPDAAAGFRLVVHGGRVERAEPVGAPPGTRVVVRDLFFNVPARRSGLRQPATELARVLATVAALALGFPHVAFHVRQGGRTLLRTSGSGDVLRAGAEIYGPATGRALLALAGGDGDVQVSGFVGAPWVARADRSEQHVLVNGRAVLSAALRAALERPFRHLLPAHRHPLAALLIQVPPEAVDVNVHPSKLEVRFADEAAVLAAVEEAVARALASARLVAPLWPRREPSPAPAAGEAASAYGPAGGGAGRVAEASAAPAPAGSPAVAGEPPARAARERPTAEPEAEVAEPAEAGDADRRLPPLRVLGVLDDTYIVAAGPDGLYVIDQHAAHERVTFERLLAAGQQGPPPRQRLAVPVPVELTPAEYAAWERWRDRVEAYGFAAEPFGPQAVLLREVPALLGGPAPADGFLALLAALAEQGHRDEPPAPAALEADLARRILASCKASVKAHDRLAPAEVEALLAQLAAAREPWTCPHGRPTVLRLSLGALAHHFQR